MTEEILSVKEAAAKLCVVEMTIYRRHQRGDFPHAYKKNRRLYIPASDITVYLPPPGTTAPAATSAPKPSTEPTPPSEPIPQPETVTLTTDVPTRAMPTMEQAEAEMAHIRIAFGNWFLYEKQYVKAPKQHHTWTKLKILMWDVGVVGGGFFETIFRRIREGAERRRNALQPPKEPPASG